MTTMLKSRTISVSIDRTPDEVYRFVTNPENLPNWAAGLCKSVRKSDSDWIVETPQGAVAFRFVPANSLGVMDHYVTPAPGVEIYVPMRVVPNGPGSELLFTLFRLPDMSDEDYAKDAALVENDLNRLKDLLES